MAQTKDLEKPEIGEEPKFIDTVALECFIENIDEALSSACENPDEAIAYLRDFFTRNFGQNLPTRQERYRREREAKEAKLKQERATNLKQPV